MNRQALRKLGWSSFVIWECETEDPQKLDSLVNRFVRRFIPDYETKP
jgi:G:T-mismatch repair DNA endonuclease (very short patch repair protein)